MKIKTNLLRKKYYDIKTLDINPTILFLKINLEQNIDDIKGDIQDSIDIAFDDIKQKLTHNDFSYSANGEVDDKTELGVLSICATLTILTPSELDVLKDKLLTLKACLTGMPAFEKMVDEIESLL